MRLQSVYFVCRTTVCSAEALVFISEDIKPKMVIYTPLMVIGRTAVFIKAVKVRGENVVFADNRRC